LLFATAEDVVSLLPDSLDVQSETWQENSDLEKEVGEDCETSY